MKTKKERKKPSLLLMTIGLLVKPAICYLYTLFKDQQLLLPASLYIYLLIFTHLCLKTTKNKVLLFNP